ncbi:hypothetical protein SynBIOSE41_02052 [Synechococcus sp. BIOS-E4-1]|nr:hypothetical protein SynBIOSE41_02052 [Synechococcus sp. BIOS-E4-1]
MNQSKIHPFAILPLPSASSTFGSASTHVSNDAKSDRTKAPGQ